MSFINKSQVHDIRQCHSFHYIAPHTVDTHELGKSWENYEKYCKQKKSPFFNVSMVVFFKSDEFPSIDMAWNYNSVDKFDKVLVENENPFWILLGQYILHF